MPIKFTKKPAKAEITTEKKTKGNVIESASHQEEVSVPSDVSDMGASIVSQPLCEVGVELSYTHNLGNYTSARVQVSIMIPCPQHDIDGVFDYARKWADDRLSNMVEELTSEG